MDFATKFKGYVRTATPLVMVNTFDARATMRNILEVLESSKDAKGKSLLSTTGISQWDACQGLRGFNELGQTQVKDMILKSKTPPQALLMAENVYKILAAVPPDCMDSHFTFIFNAHKFWNNAIEVQGLWNLRDVLAEKGSMLILLASPGSVLPEEIAQDVMFLDEPLPNDAQVEALITKAYDNAKIVAEANNKKIPAKLPADMMKKSKAAMVGLPAFPIAQSSALCLDSFTGNMDTVGMWDQKRQTISQRAGLSMFEREGVSLANLDDMDNVISFLNQYNCGMKTLQVYIDHAAHQ